MSEWGRDLKLLEERVRSVEIAFSTLKDTVEKEKKFIPVAEVSSLSNLKLQRLKSMINQQQTEVEYINNHLPAKLPGNHLVSSISDVSLSRY